MEALQEYIKKYYIKIPNYVENSNKSIILQWKMVILI